MYKVPHLRNTNANHTIALTQAQARQIVNAGNSGKGTTIMVKKSQIDSSSPYAITVPNPKPGMNKFTAEQVGGFLPFLGPLIGIASKVLPALGMSALSGLASSGASAIVDKLAGKGVYRLPNPQRRTGGNISKDAKQHLVTAINILKSTGLLAPNTSLSSGIKTLCKMVEEQ